MTRFGWKAQNKSLAIFAAEAYNVEQGVTNEGFPNERDQTPGCQFNPTPEDRSRTDGTIADVNQFVRFMLLTAPPTPAPLSASAQNGQRLFTQTGCALCHTPTLTTGASTFTGMSTVTYHPFSDFALHNMGAALADGIRQGAAGPDEFRTAPLWGLGQRLFFLHDGRTSNLLQAIQAHASSTRDCVNSWDVLQFRANGAPVQPYVYSQSCGSEANTVITLFNRLTPAQKQDLLNFLRSL